MACRRRASPSFIDRAILDRTYPDELRTGAVKANARVAESLFRKATGDGPQSVAAAIFRLKTRAGWKETSVHELTGRAKIEAMSDEEMDARILQLADMLRIDLGWPPVVTVEPHDGD